MGASVATRDYRLIGDDGRLAVESGLAGAEWYACPIPRKRMKELMKRDDGPATRDTLLWFGYMAAFGLGGYLFWGTWLCVPFFICYGVLYGSASDSRWHECGHGTAFKTPWKNDVVYHIACFMILREPTIWRWSHTRHHTDTIIVGRDPEIASRRPAGYPRHVAQPVRAQVGLGGAEEDRAACDRQARPRGGDLRSGNGATQGLSGRADLAGDLRRGGCRLLRFGQHPAGHVHRPCRRSTAPSW
jgi:hypothetical protein